MKGSFYKYFGNIQMTGGGSLVNGGILSLEQLALKVTPPREFNDPFEFSAVVKDFVTRSDARRHLIAGVLAGDEANQLPQELLNDLAEVVLEAASDQAEVNYKIQQSILPSLSRNYGVVCFSTVPDNPLMWAHYTSAHVGIMLEFDCSAPLFHTPRFFPVEYQNDRVILERTVGDELSHITTLARVKSSAWRYESEYRLIVPLVETKTTCDDDGKKLHLLKLDPKWIVSVTVGLRASVGVKSDINRLRQRPELKHVRRYRMVMHASTFQLLREEVKGSW
ncbi:MAG: DUF2971 domain-containing protein [Verrucomicrobiia bacterium]